MRQVRTPAVVAVLVAIASGCAHLPRVEDGGSRPAALPPSSPGLVAADLGTQHLFRVRYRGAQGSGTLRLILKIEARDRYRIETKDRFGRGFWRIDVGSAETLLVDDRRKLYCRSPNGVRIPEIALESLPLRELPAILLGRLPGDLQPGTEGGEYRDSRGRRWTTSGAEARPDSWTVWEEGEPWLWWRKDDRGEGVLSHREGSQLRWRRFAGEPLTEKLTEIRLESRHRLIACDDWAAGAATSPLLR